jgi:tetratricopeptide (TPR) repeat protein
MSHEEADDFLQRLIDAASDPAAFAHLDRERIMKASDRNPLVMQWVTAQIDLAQEANTVLNELAQGVGDAAQRVFDRSFELEQLGDDGRAALLALSLFAPDASRDALGDVAGFGGDAARLNGAVKLLAGLSLVKTTTDSRLVMEGLTRELTRSRMIKDKLGEEFRQRFVAHFLRYAQAHAQPVAEDYDALEAERDNLLSAMELALTQKDWNTLMTIRLALDGFLDVHGYWEDAIITGKGALTAAAETKQDQALGIFSHNLAVIYQRRGDYHEALRLYDESLQINKQLGDQSGIASTLHELGRLSQAQGDLGEARRLYDESLQIKKQLGNQSGIAKTLHQLAMLAQAQGDLGEARRLYDESLQIASHLGDQSGIASSLHELGLLAQAQGDLGEARRLYDESLQISKQLGDQSGIAISLHELGRLAQAQGDNGEARRLYAESLQIKKQLGNQSGIANTLHELGLLAHAQGDLGEARRLYDESVQIEKQLGNQSGIAISLHQLGRLAEDEGNDGDASRLFSEALAIFEKLKSPYAEIARGSLERVQGRN